jgi:hypothetical protein
VQSLAAGRANKATARSQLIVAELSNDGLASMWLKYDS